jgi:hypothetical protein
MVHVSEHAAQRWLERFDPATPDAAASVRGSLAAAMPFRPDRRLLPRECGMAIKTKADTAYFVNATDGAVFVCLLHLGQAVRVVTVLKYADVVKPPRMKKW